MPEDGRRIVERVLGDQAGIRFTTQVDIVNRGIVSMRLSPAAGNKP
jgi:hypothetical protein